MDAASAPRSESLFRALAADYARFRPVYPQALYDWLLYACPASGLAWDVGTGNGQVARHLAEYFERVWATDLSPEQLAQAPAHENVHYRAASAHASGLPDASADLVTVAQAIHWFPLEAFYAEVRRAAKPGALLLVWGYDLPVLPQAPAAVLQHLYTGVLGSDWDAARRHIDTRYRELPFPFQPVEVPPIQMPASFTLETLVGYVASWSALHTYRTRTGHDPLPDFAAALAEAWPMGQHSVEAHFPLFFRAGRIA